MIPLPPEEQKKEAFRLFEDGRYQESLLVCNLLLESEKDPALEILAATNLYASGRYEDAEVFFRDLAMRMPDSSYVHSYLAKVLAARDDEAAVGEYAAAVRLDPANLDAVRSYAEYLLSREDWRGALPTLRSLVTSAQKPGDIRNLMTVLIRVGETDAALALHDRHPGETAHFPAYIEALTRTGRFREAAETAHALWRKNADTAIFFLYLHALAGYDMKGAIEACASLPEDQQDKTFLYEYIRLLQAAGETEKALQAAGRLLHRCPGDPLARLTECELLAAAGHADRALDRYERLVQDELAAKNDLEMLGRIIGEYRMFITEHLPGDEAAHRFMDLVSRDQNVVSLLETARFFETAGNPAEARSWYYRAYRADFLLGGPDYARFLAGAGDERECEKVMLYILANVRKGRDLEQIASMILETGGRMRHLKRLISQVINRLEERRASLSSGGRELLAMAFFIAASHALEGKEYAAGKYFCLAGLDVLPACPQALRAYEFLAILQECKDAALADPPALQDRPRQKRRAARETVTAIPDLPGLTEQEEKIVSFLRSHRTATEMELRKLLGTRRVAGLVNRLMQKAASQGIIIIEKRGVGENGEIYGYTGT
jgi:thioredoxin-like negative regulator of GroEL